MKNFITIPDGYENDMVININQIILVEYLQDRGTFIYVNGHDKIFTNLSVEAVKEMIEQSTEDK